MFSQLALARSSYCFWKMTRDWHFCIFVTKLFGYKTLFIPEGGCLFYGSVLRYIRLLQKFDIINIFFIYKLSFLNDSNTIFEIWGHLQNRGKP